jgi:hypothetical protein
MTIHLEKIEPVASEPTKLICPLLSAPGKPHTCKKSQCAWYVKYQSVVDTSESGCAVARIALTLLSRELE